jgi:ABC-type transporter Mla subunit MlaD
MMSDLVLGTERRGSVTRKVVLGVISTLLVSAFVGWKVWVVTRPALVLTACFHDALGLKEDAAVRVGGVEVGAVRSIHHQVGDCPVNVELRMPLQNGLHLPKNTTATLQSDGILGPTYVDIKLSGIPGPPIENHARLETVEYTGLLTPEASAKLKKTIGDEIDRMTAKPLSGSQDPATEKK